MRVRYRGLPTRWPRSKGWSVTAWVRVRGNRPPGTWLGGGQICTTSLWTAIGQYWYHLKMQTLFDPVIILLGIDLINNRAFVKRPFYEDIQCSIVSYSKKSEMNWMIITIHVERRTVVHPSGPVEVLTWNKLRDTLSRAYKVNRLIHSFLHLTSIFFLCGMGFVCFISTLLTYYSHSTQFALLKYTV